MNKGNLLLSMTLFFLPFAVCAIDDLTDMQKTEILRCIPAPTEPSFWLEPDPSRRAYNAAFEKANGLEPGDAVRILGRLLEEEILSPNGGDSNTVARLVDAVLKSGDNSITNVLDRLLFAKTNPWRGMVFCARTGFCGVDQRALAEQVVRRLPSSERELCYVAAFPFIVDTRKGVVNKRELEVTAVLEECAIAETDPLLVSAIDKELASRHNWWKSRNLRKRIARRYADTESAAGQYFRSVIAEIGEPRAFTSQDIWEHLIDRSFEPNGCTEEQNKKLQYYRNRHFALDFGLTAPETLRHLEHFALGLLKEKKATPEGKENVSHVLCAIYRSGEASSTNMLYEALFAEWNPNRLCALDGLFLHVDPSAALKISRRLLEKQEMFSAYERMWCYRQLTGLAAEGKELNIEVQKEVVAFLREVAARDEGQSIAAAVDRWLLKDDPSWARSEDRRRLAARIAAQTPENPIVTAFKDLLKEIGEPADSKRE